MRPLYCDESIWIPVADGLRRRGWTVHTTRNEDRLGDRDTEQLAYALDNDWILVTLTTTFYRWSKTRISTTLESSTFSKLVGTSVTS